MKIIRFAPLRCPAHAAAWFFSTDPYWSSTTERLVSIGPFPWSSTPRLKKWLNMRKRNTLPARRRIDEQIACTDGTRCRGELIVSGKRANAHVESICVIMTYKFMLTFRMHVPTCSGSLGQPHQIRTGTDRSNKVFWFSDWSCEKTWEQVKSPGSEEYVSITSLWKRK